MCLASGLCYSLLLLICFDLILSFDAFLDFFSLGKT